MQSRETKEHTCGIKDRDKLKEEIIRPEEQRTNK
jgi:hypothetical protein